MEPDRQIEIQLGHMCNNRCVFCVSGQRTAMREAGPMPEGPTLEAIRRARKAGHTKITLLGGEPTLQPAFLRIVSETVSLGFEEIVLFTNGVKTARAAFVDAILATGGNFTWRISIQGATRDSHERTTRKPGSFGRILKTLENLAARDQRITVNMCVVQSNHEDVGQFPSLLQPFGVQQLHLDMFRPLDAGTRTEEELRETVPRYSALVDPLRDMIAGFEPGFDVNVGNLPFCIAPDISPWIHHDGERTDTIAIDGDDRLSRPWNKYLVKRRDKLHPASCERCVMRPRCSGIFETYADFHGVEELQPIEASALRDADRSGQLLGIWAPRLLEGSSAKVRARSDREVEISLGGVVVRISPEPSDRARYRRFGVHVVDDGGDVSAMARLLAAIDDPIVPLGPLAPPRLRQPLARLRRAAPFGRARWQSLSVTENRLELELVCGASRARFWIGWRDGARGGYEVEGEPDGALVDALRQAMQAVGAASGEPSSDSRG